MRIRWVLRLLGWNALLLLAGVVLIAIVGEAWFRLSRPLSMPFRISDLRSEFVPNVGVLFPPNTEIRSTNRRDFWTVSRTNSLGFLDREPPSPERAAATCHISMIGDSFVEAREVPVRDKFHVRLEELAAEELPHLDITTSAFGIEDTGQVQQLPFYDEYARLLHPKLLVLVFVHNDFHDNLRVPEALTLRGPNRRNFLQPTVERRSDGKFQLSPPPPQDPPPRSSQAQSSWAARAMEKALDRSWLVFSLHRKLKALSNALFPDMDMDQAGSGRSLKPRRQQYTRFALEQFKQRADRDGARLVILASHSLTIHELYMFGWLSQMAATLGIPVIDQADYILRQGAGLTDANWPHDFHWNPAGHRWAAEALLEYIEEHPAICDGPT